MDAQYSQVFHPLTMPELYSDWSRFRKAAIYAGGTSFIYGQSTYSLILPSNIISLGRIEELKRVSRTERYLEIGAMVELNDILRLGKIVPKILRDIIRQAANPAIRNLVTMGGSICYPHGRLDVIGPLVALDARYELRTAAATRWIAASRFVPSGKDRTMEAQELLTRIRIPLESWDYSAFRKFGDQKFGSPDTGTIVLIARIQKNILNELRLVFAGKALIREKDSEIILAGKKLPLEDKDILAFTGHWKEYMDNLGILDDLLRFRMLKFIESNIIALAG